MNILDKYRLPLFAPETEAGSDLGTGDAGGAPPGGGDGAPGGTAGSDGGAPLKLTIRQSLEKGFKDAREAEAKPRTEKGQFEPRKPKRAADEMREEADTTATNEEQVDAAGEQQVDNAGQQQQQTTTEPPAAWSKEAKAAWATLPKLAQDAILKREVDVQKGVDELKAKYNDLDVALQPHLPVIRQHGHTPAQAVNQLFDWFQALGNNPDQAFPALMQSFRWDPRRLFPQGLPGQQQQQPTAQPGAQPPQLGADGKPVAPAQQPVANIPPELLQTMQAMQNEIQQLRASASQQIHGLQTSFQQRQYAETEATMNNWAKDKPHFEKVRQTMAQLVGSGIIPLKDGRVDLDAAYQTAVRMDPEIFAAEQQATQAKLQADIQAKATAAKKAQEDAAAKARAAAKSITPASPGQAPGQRANQKPKKGLSVRESLLAAIEENRV